jgi:SAM-dependent methyltransferase
MNLSYTNNSFDVVCGSSVLHHLDLIKSYKEIFRVLKPEGRMVFAEPNMLNPQIFIQKKIPFIKKWLGDSPDETAIIRWAAKKQLTEIGFKKVRIFPYDFLHPATPSFLITFIQAIGMIVEKIPVLKEIGGSVIIFGEK